MIDQIAIFLVLIPIGILLWGCALSAIYYVISYVVSELKEKVADYIREKTMIKFRKITPNGISTCSVSKNWTSIIESLIDDGWTPSK